MESKPEEKPAKKKQTFAERLASMKTSTFKAYKAAHDDEGLAIEDEVVRRKSEVESL